MCFALLQGSGLCLHVPISDELRREAFLRDVLLFCSLVGEALVLMLQEGAGSRQDQMWNENNNLQDCPVIITCSKFPAPTLLNKYTSQSDVYLCP